MWAAVTGADGKRHGDGYDKEADVYMHDPMRDPLPNAPSMKMYCAYGVDKPVERCALPDPVHFRLPLVCASSFDTKNRCAGPSGVALPSGSGHHMRGHGAASCKVPRVEL